MNCHKFGTSSRPQIPQPPASAFMVSGPPPVFNRGGHFDWSLKWAPPQSSGMDPETPDRRMISIQRLSRKIQRRSSITSRKGRSKRRSFRPRTKRQSSPRSLATNSREKRNTKRAWTCPLRNHASRPISCSRLSMLRASSKCLKTES